MNRWNQVTSTCTKIIRRDEAEITKALIRDEAEVRTHMRRLHAHMILLCVNVIVISVMVTSDIAELTIFCTAWFLTGCQEYADALGMM